MTEQEEKRQNIWNYYKTIAVIDGYPRDKNGEIEKNEDGTSVKPFGFSLAWFYEKFDPKYSSPLMRAFLGDDNALARIQYKGISAPSEDKIYDLCVKNGNTINDSQLSVIEHALNQDVTIVEGPPGNGKTHAIVHLLRCIRHFEPEATIAVVSSNAKAIDNIVEKLESDVDLHQDYMRLGNQKNRKDFVNTLREKLQNGYIPTVKIRPNEPCKTIEEILDQARPNDKELHFFSPDLLRYYPIMFSTIHSLLHNIDAWEDKERFHYHFDYVIIDETSQVSPLVGMVALWAAKKLVLFGDSKQLQPIYKSKDKYHPTLQDQIESAASKLPDLDLYCSDGFTNIQSADNKEGAGNSSTTSASGFDPSNSFLKACKKRFGKYAANILLKEHYRCHPAIIGFCNENVYDNQIIIKSEDDGTCPIRIHWYEGDYWERRQETKEKKSYNVNDRQIIMFMEEEYEAILYQRLENDPRFSVCIISPYRKQLEILKEQIDQYNASHGGLVDEAVLNEPDQEDYADGSEQYEQNDNEPLIDKRIQELTIHKSQGKEFDLVCLMTVIDEPCSSAKWAQRWNMMNVSVSRAKSELVVLCSATWLPEEIQKDRLGYVCHKDLSEYPLRKLTEYVNRQLKQGRVKSGYGFVQTEIQSIFDKVPFFRKRVQWIDDAGTKKFAPEMCFLDAFKKDNNLSTNYQIEREVPLLSVQQISAGEDDDLHNYIQNGARFDFVLRKKEKIHFIIEVDGNYHRIACSDTNSLKIEDETKNNNKAAKYDQLKDRAVESIGDGFKNYRYLRLATNGTTRDEIKEIHNMLSAADDAEVSCPSFTERHNLLVYLLHNKFSDTDNYISHMSEKEIISILQNQLNFMEQNSKGNLSGHDFAYSSKKVDSLYFWRFGIAYAFEYSYIFEKLILDYIETSKDYQMLGICDIGCGSMIAAWAAAYAADHVMNVEGLEPGQMRLLYQGVDIKKWGTSFRNESILKEIYSYEDGKCCLKFTKKDLVDFFKDEKENYFLFYNVLMFPKILNELSDEQIVCLCNTIENRIRKASAFQFSAYSNRVHYIIASHSKNNLESGLEHVDDIVDAMNCRGNFEISYDFILDEFQDSDKNLIAPQPNRNNLRYFEAISEKHFEEINPDFSRLAVFNKTDNKMYQYFKKSDCKEERYPMTQAKNAVFQIIRLKPKDT